MCNISRIFSRKIVPSFSTKYLRVRLEYLILHIIRNFMRVLKIKCIYVSTSRILISSLRSIFPVTISFSNVKPSIVVRAELSQRHFIFRREGELTSEDALQFIALGNLRAPARIASNRAPQVLLRCDSFSSFYLSGLCPRRGVRLSLEFSPARRCTCTIEKTPLHAQRRRERVEKKVGGDDETFPAVFRE